MACKKGNGVKKGVAVAGLAAAAAVAKKAIDNNPDGVKDVNGDGKVDYKDYIEVAKDAAMEVAKDAKDKAPELKEGAEKAFDLVKEKLGK